MGSFVILKQRTATEGPLRKSQEDEVREAPKGFSPLGSSRHGGWYRDKGGKREYWFPSEVNARAAYRDHQASSRAHWKDSEHHKNYSESLAAYGEMAPPDEYDASVEDSALSYRRYLEHKGHAEGAKSAANNKGLSGKIDISSHPHLIDSSPGIDVLVSPASSGFFRETGREIGTLRHVKALQDRALKDLSLDRIDPLNYKKRIQSLDSQYNEQSGRFDKCLRNWSATTNPFRDGSVGASFDLRAFSIALGLSTWQRESHDLSRMFLSKKRFSHDSIKNFHLGLNKAAGSIRAFLDPGHKDHKTMEYMLARQAILSTYMEEDAGSGMILVYRGLSSIPEHEVQLLEEGRFDQSAASSWSTEEGIAHAFTKGGEPFNVVVSAEIPVQHCLAAWMTDASLHMEREVIVGSCELAQDRTATLSGGVEPDGSLKKFVHLVNLDISGDPDWLASMRKEREKK